MTRAMAMSPSSPRARTVTPAQSCASAARASVRAPHTKGVDPDREMVRPMSKKSTGVCAPSSRSIARPRKPRSRVVRPRTLRTSAAAMAKLSGSASVASAEAARPLRAVAVPLPAPDLIRDGRKVARIAGGRTASTNILLARSMSAHAPVAEGANSFTKTKELSPAPKVEAMNARDALVAPRRGASGGSTARDTSAPTHSWARACAALMAGRPMALREMVMPRRPLKMTAGRSALSTMARTPARAFLS
mmetsp:Transcript_19269/g.61021  ORF Transcript_19269/g.61021 Transcript_19269/m.61021 type:complete len:248 (+) Transcript_19269:674-1417(+)